MNRRHRWPLLALAGFIVITFQACSPFNAAVDLQGSLSSVSSTPSAPGVPPPAKSAPSPVTGLAAKDVSFTTIPVSYAGANGGGAMTYAGYVALHGSSNWTLNEGAFDSNGGAFSGLSAGTTYDLRIQATNDLGKSTADFTSGISTPSEGAFARPANRYDIVLDASAAAPGAPVTGRLYPNGSWRGQTITLAGPSNAGVFDQAAITTPNGSSASVSFRYTPSKPGEIAISGSNSGGLYNPYPAPLVVFNPSLGAPQALSIAVTPANNGHVNDPQPRQYDTLATPAKGFAFQGAKGYGSVALRVSSVGGATDGLWVKLYDADSPGAVASGVGTGAALTSDPVQVYGSFGAGDLHIMLPASKFLYYVDAATDAAFSSPVRVPQRITVGLIIGMIGRSQEAGFAQWYADNTVPTGENWINTLTMYSSDARYSVNGSGDVGFLRQTGAAKEASHADGSDTQGPSGGAQAAGRIIASSMGVNLAIIGIAATGGGVDRFIAHDGQLTAPATETFNDAGGIDGKFRWLWAASLDGWDNVSEYPGSLEEYKIRFRAAIDWIAKNYPACAVQGWGAGGTGRPEGNGSGEVLPGPLDVGGADSPGKGAARLQAFFLDEAEAVAEPNNPMVVSKENYAWKSFDFGHADSGSRRIYVQTGLRQLLSAEIAANGGAQSNSRGPSLLASGTASASSRIVRIYGRLNGGGGLQTVQIRQQKPTYSVSFGQASASELVDLISLYGPGGYSGNGLPIRVSGVAINYSNLIPGADFSLDATLAGSSGVTYADGSTGSFPSGFNVHYAADLQASGGNGYVVAYMNGGTPPRTLSTMICDTQVNGPWEWGRHIRPRLNISVTTAN